MRREHVIDLSEMLARREIPSGPPLNLEQAGNVTALLKPFLTPQRFERLGAVMAKRTRHITTLLDAVHDPHNISACMRSSDAFGLQDLHLIPPHEKRSTVSTLVSKGAQRWLTIHAHSGASEAIEVIKSHGYRLIAAGVDPSGNAATPETLDLSEPVCLVMGNEHLGVSKTLHEAADEFVHIPMQGFVESLNVSVAYALLMRSMRSRLESENSARYSLSTSARTELMDIWMLEEIPHVRVVFRALAKRHTDSLSSGDGSA